MNPRGATLPRRAISIGFAMLAVALSSASGAPASAQVAPASHDEIDAYIVARMKDLGIPGAALVIVEGDRIVHLKGFGVADGEGGAVTPKSPFFTGSTGKSFTALAIMQLVEAGKIALDAPVQSYLPWFRTADADASRTITVRQLMNMTSGIPRAIGQEQIANHDLSDLAIENNVRALADVELVASPGEHYEYSNANYVTLGMLVQVVTGESYETYITKHIFEPLDMQHSYTSKAEGEDHGLVVGFQTWFGVPVASPDLPFSRGTLPAGQLSIGMEDMGHYLIAQLNGGRYQRASVLSPAGIAELQRPQVQMPGTSDYYAMGWEVQHVEDIETISHNGAVPGFTTGMFLVPEKRLALALTMNTFSPMLGVRVQRVPSSVLRMLLGQTVMPGYEFRSMRLVYAGVMLIPLLYVFAVVEAMRRECAARMGAQRAGRGLVARDIIWPLIWNGAIAYALLVILPRAFDANISTVVLFQPDVGWVSLISGVFAIAWGLISAGMGVAVLRRSSRTGRRSNAKP